MLHFFCRRQDFLETTLQRTQESGISLLHVTCIGANAFLHPNPIKCIIKKFRFGTGSPSMCLSSVQNSK